MAGELMVEEYRSLRRELLQLAASISRWQLVGFVAGALALGTVGLRWPPFATPEQSSAWPLAMVPALVVIAGSVFGVIHDITSIVRIAAFIHAFHEGTDTG